MSRGGLKLRHALDEFAIDPAGWTCADLGCSTGGFTDVLIQAGAARVYSVDTAYGELAWTLRNHDRVVVMERTNALHAPAAEQVDLVVIDLGWTRQSRAIPAALTWLKPTGRVISLVKPHYEVARTELGPKGRLDPDRAQEVAETVRDSLGELGVKVLGWTKSPVIGGAKGKGKKGKGNPEWLVLLGRVESIS